MNATVIDRLEKLGRLVLWLAIAAAFVLTPLGMRAQAKEAARAADRTLEEQRAEQKRAKADQEKQAAEKLARIPLRSMGSFLLALNGSTGQIWFTNVSMRAGFLCVQGQAKSAKGETESLPACEEVHPYSSGTIKMLFAGAIVAKLCPQSDCEFSVKDAQ